MLHTDKSITYLHGKWIALYGRKFLFAKIVSRVGSKVFVQKVYCGALSTGANTAGVSATKIMSTLRNASRRRRESVCLACSLSLSGGR